MSRKHVTLQALQHHVEPPGEGQHIVRAVGGRGSNITEVEFPDGTRTLCFLPARFHKKLWIKTGSFLIVENSEVADTRVTGQVLSVLLKDDVKELRKLPGVWPPEFEDRPDAEPQAGEPSQPQHEEGAESGGSESESNDDGLPPLERINNRRVVEYEVSDSSDSD